MRSPLARRTFLRGVGALIALPALEAMLPTHAHAAAVAPLRFVGMWFSNGVVQKGAPNTTRNYWGCTGTTNQWELSRTLQPLAAHKADLNVIDGLYNVCVANTGGAAHWAATTSFLAGRRHNPQGLNLAGPGRSIDQEMADLVGTQTPLRTLTMGAQPASSAPAGDHRGTGVYLTNISWESQYKLAHRHETSSDVFNALFGAGSVGPNDRAAELRRAGRLSILDLVQDDASRLRTSLGAADRQRLDQYLTEVRAVEQRIQAEEGATASTCVAPPVSIYQSETYRERVQNMIDLMVLAFQCDLTRVSTFMLDNEHNYASLATSVGTSSGKHHDVSHYDMNATLPAATAINAWQVQRFALLLDRLKATKDLDGSSMLDNAMVLYGTGLGDGDSHTPTGTPVVLAGKAGGRLTTGRLLHANGAPYPNLLASLVERWGKPVTAWGEGNGLLSIL